MLELLIFDTLRMFQCQNYFVIIFQRLSLSIIFLYIHIFKALLHVEHIFDW
jgi:hypothetical protein